MKKTCIVALSACLLVSSCSTTTQGAYTGGSFGTILGSAIGGLLGGPRGSDIGTIVGMAGGAALGAAAGNASEKQAVRDHYERVQANKAQGYNPYDNDSETTYSNSLTDENQSGFDPNNSGDDRLFAFDKSEPIETATTTNASSSSAEALTPSVEIRNVQFYDTNHDGALSRGEKGEVVFEVVNRGKYPLDNIEPTVLETTGCKHILVSPSIRVERIMPGEGIRYTATVQASRRIKDGRVSFMPMVKQGGASIGKASAVSVNTHRQ